jgi:hypothetical protein
LLLALMLSSLFPRGSVYASLDDEQGRGSGEDDAATVFDEAMEHSNAIDDGHEEEAARHVPDPFEQHDRQEQQQQQLEQVMDPFHADPSEDVAGEASSMLTRTRLRGSATANEATIPSTRRHDVQDHQHKEPPMSMYVASLPDGFHRRKLF